MYCVYRLWEVKMFIECCVCTVFTGCGRSRCLLSAVYVLCLQAVGGQDVY